MSPRDLLDHGLVGSLYDCADSPEGLRPFLKELSGIFGAHQAHVMVLEANGQVLQTHAHGHDDASFGDYESHWLSQDPRFLAASGSPGCVLSDAQVIDPKLFESSAIYNDFLSRFNVRYTLFVNFQIAPNLLGGQSFMRPKSAGAFEPAHAQQL